MELRNRVAMVTGANRGIGLEISRQLARAGARVLMVAREAAEGQEAVDRLTAEGLTVELRVADLAQETDIERLFAEHEGPLHLLVNNAGVIDQAVPTWEEAVADWDRVMTINLRAPFLMCRAFVPRMIQSGWGRIINVSSGMGTYGGGLDGGFAAYRVSKAGLNALTRNLAADLEAQPILVNAMCPGWVRTRMGGDRAPRTVEQGAQTARFLATLPDDGPRGLLFRDQEVIPW